MKIYLLIAALMVLNVKLNSQSIQVFKGKFEGGAGQYSYYIDENEERIKHGYFSYTTGFYDGIGIFRYFREFRISGNYKNGKNNGMWLEERIDYKVGYSGATFSYDPLTHKKVVDGFQNDNANKYILNKHIVKSNFRDGVLNGNYKSEIFELLENKGLSLVRYVNASFLNGNLFGKYSYYIQGIEVIGQFDSLGYIDGTWIKKDYLSNYGFLFDKGCLVKLIERNKDEGTLVKKFENFKLYNSNSLENLNCEIENIDNKSSLEKYYETRGDSIFTYQLVEDETEKLNIGITLDELNQTQFVKCVQAYKTKSTYLHLKPNKFLNFQKSLPIARKKFIEENNMIDSSDYYKNQKDSLYKIWNIHYVNIQIFRNRRKNFYYSDSIPYFENLVKSSNDDVLRKENQLYEYKRKFYKSSEGWNEKISESKFVNLPESPLLKTWVYTDSLNTLSFKITQLTTIGFNDFVIDCEFTYNNKHFNFTNNFTNKEFFNGDFTITIDNEAENTQFNFTVSENIINTSLKLNKTEKLFILISE